LANQNPPSNSIALINGINETKGKKPISMGDITIAPPKPLKRRTMPPKVALKIIKAKVNQSTELNL